MGMFSGKSGRPALQLVLVPTALLLAATVHAADCNRAALTEMTDNYLGALSRQDAKGVPFSAQVKYTENAQPLKIGEGLWTTAGKTIFQRKLIDVERCGTLIQAVIEEKGMEKNTILGVRLQVADGRITEVETIIARATEFAHNPDGVLLEDGDDWEAIVPVNERTPREVMNAVADQYFDMFDTPAIGKDIPFATPCNRYENGTKTTRGDCANMGPAGRGGMKMTQRRYLLSDLEAGMTAGFVLFGGRLLDVHMFKFRNGKVTQIQAVVGPGVASDGWD